MKLVIRRSTMVHTDIKLDLVKDWKKLKKSVESAQGDDLFEDVDISSAEEFIADLNAGIISESEVFDFLLNYDAGGKREPDEFGDESYQTWVE